MDVDVDVDLNVVLDAVVVAVVSLDDGYARGATLVYGHDSVSDYVDDQVQVQVHVHVHVHVL